MGRENSSSGLAGTSFIRTALFSNHLRISDLLALVQWLFIKPVFGSLWGGCSVDQKPKHFSLTIRRIPSADIVQPLGIDS